MEPAPPRPAVTRLALADVRNHDRLVLEPGEARLVVLTGPNGAGKTAVLEALSLLAPGRGLRQARLDSIGRRDAAGGFAVAAALAVDGEGPPLDVRLDTRGPGQPRGPRQPLVDGARSSLARLAEWLSFLWLVPAMDRLFVEAPAQRRRFLDRMVQAVAPGHALAAARYEAAMRERTRLLEQPAPDRAWLDALEARMAEEGAALARARADAVARLDERIAASADRRFPAAALALGGETGPAEPDALARRLAAGRAGDAAAGRALAGPHRADLAVLDRATGAPAAEGSTGEQKAMLVGLLLAQAEEVATRRGRPPLMLLDEVAAHLDPGRRAALVERLDALAGQSWLTGTDPELFAAAHAWRATLPPARPAIAGLPPPSALG